MTSSKLDATFDIVDAINRDDEAAGRDAAIAIAKSVIGNVSRIADALDHIARNIAPPASPSGGIA